MFLLHLPWAPALAEHPCPGLVQEQGCLRLPCVFSREAMGAMRIGDFPMRSMRK